MGGESHRGGVAEPDRSAVEAVRAVLDARVPAQARVVVAVSGGPDSTALLALTAAARPDLLLVVAHVRHGLRNDAADARVARDHATRLGLPLAQRDVTVDRNAAEGPEAAARAARYEALVDVAAGAGAGWVLFGHTADDLAETVLLNLARGSGVRGLAGMAVERRQGPVRVVRPLLGLRRAAVRLIPARGGLPVAVDPTNVDPDQRRARVRAEVLPALGRLSGGAGRAEGHGDPVPALTRLARLARDDAEALDEIAERSARRLLVRWGPARALALAPLAQLPRAVAGRVVRVMLAEVRGRGDGMSAESVWAVLGLRAGGALHVHGGVWVTSGGGWLAALPAGEAELVERPLRLPGRTPLPELAGAVLAGGAEAGRGPDAVLPFGGRVPLPGRVPAGADLVVRARRAGDRLPSAGGWTSVADLLARSGVPRAVRGLVPVVARPDGDVCWVAGVGSAAWSADAVPVRLTRG